MYHWPLTPYVHCMNVRASQLSLQLRGPVTIARYVDAAKQTVTLLAGVARVMKWQRCQPQPCLKRSQKRPEDLLHRSNFLHSTGSFDTKEGWIKTLLGYITTQYYLPPDSIRFWNYVNSHQMVQSTDAQYFKPQNSTAAYCRVVPPTPAKWKSSAFGNEAVQRLTGSILQRAL